jgi:hypothetical protein
MTVLNFIIGVVALVIAILAYRKAGGVADLKKQIDQIASSVDFRKPVDTLAAATETIREKTAEAIGKLEATVRGEGKEEKKPPKGTTLKRRPKEEKEITEDQA